VYSFCELIFIGGLFKEKVASTILLCNSTVRSRMALVIHEMLLSPLIPFRVTHQCPVPKCNPSTHECLLNRESNIVAPGATFFNSINDGPETCLSTTHSPKFILRLQL